MAVCSRILPLLGALLPTLLALPLHRPPLASQVTGAEPHREPSQLFVETIDVDVVNVEVVVTDRSGEPVRGLTREDFVVREDGERVALTNFYAVEGGERALPEEAAEPGAQADDAAPLPADQRLHLVILVDEVHLSPTARSRILDDLQEELDRVLRPGDRVLVARATPNVQVEQPFTDDPAAISATLERLRGSASRSRTSQMAERAIRSDLYDPEANPDQVLNDIRAWASHEHLTNERLLAALHRFVQAVAGLPGRRAVLFLSEGMAVRPGQPLLEEWYERFAARPGARSIGELNPGSESAFWDASLELVRLTEAAAGHHVTFYTLEGGSGFHGGLDPERAVEGSANRIADLVAGGALEDLAWRTGGASVGRGGSTAALLDRMASDYRDYYSLGYTSPHSNDGEYHRIEVEVPGRRVRVRHTRGFRATTPEQETVERTLSALVFDEESNPLDVRVELGEEQPERDERWVVPVLVRIPISSLTLLPGETAYQGRVSVVVAVRNGQGDLSEPQHLDLPVEIPNERLREAIGLQVAKGLNLLLRTGESTLAVGVRDELSGTISTVNVELSVGNEG